MYTHTGPIMPVTLTLHDALPISARKRTVPPLSMPTPPTVVVLSLTNSVVPDSIENPPPRTSASATSWSEPVNRRTADDEAVVQLVAIVVRRVPVDLYCVQVLVVV